MRFRYSFLTLLLATLSATASPTITSITPSSGPVSGGQTVTIRGNGFTGDCGAVCPRMVEFGGGLATSVRVIDAQTIEAVTPPHLPVAVDVSVCQSNGCATLPNAFTFVGYPLEEFEVLLLPLLTPPVYGAHGSQFRTELRGFNGGSTTLQIYGLDRREGVIILRPPWNPMEEPFELDSQRGIPRPDIVEPTGTPGALLYVSKNRIADLSLNLRAFDVSRTATNFGTELPIPKGSDFTTGTLMLLGVPLDPLFRNTLRIYSLASGAVRIKVENAIQYVNMPVPRTIFEPSYVEIGGFPVGAGTINVEITPLSSLPNPQWGGGEPTTWAFISVTNNETQMITTITPQP